MTTFTSRTGPKTTALRIVNFGVRVDCRDASGNNLLYYAARFLHKPMWSLLIEKKADPNCTATLSSNENYPPLACKQLLRAFYKNQDGQLTVKIDRTKKALDKLTAEQKTLRTVWATALA